MPKGPQPKHPDKRQRRNKPKLAVAPAASITRPPAPEGLLPEFDRAWEDFWDSDVARAFSIEDLPALSRLFYLRDEWERARTAVRDTGRLVRGSQGQLVVNPLSKRQDAIAGEIRQLEDRFGGNPMSRARLAVSMGEIHRTMDDLARELREIDGDRDDDPLQIVDVQDSEA